MSDHLLNEAGAGLVLGLSASEIRRLVRDGGIPHVELPTGDVRFIEADLWHWAESFRVSPTSIPLSRLADLQPA